jgi:hypothetical protein
MRKAGDRGQPSTEGRHDADAPGEAKSAPAMMFKHAAGNSSNVR